MRRQLRLAVEFLGALKATLSVSNYSTQGHVILSTACEDLFVVSNTATAGRNEHQTALNISGGGDWIRFAKAFDQALSIGLSPET